MGKGRSTLFNFLFSYILIMIIPMTIFVVMIFGYNKKIMADRVYTDNNKYLNTVKTNFDLNIWKMTSIAESNYPYIFSTAFIKMKFSNFFDIRDTLKKIRLTDSFIDDVYYYNLKVNTIYTANTLYKPEVFNNYVSVYSAIESTDLKEIVETANTPEYFSLMSKKGEFFFTFVYPLEKSFDGTSSALFFNIKKDSIDNLFVSDEKTDTLVIISNRDLDILYASEPDLAVTKKHLASVENQEGFVKLDKGLYGMSVSSNETHLKYFYFWNDDFDLKSLQNVAGMIIICLLISLLLCLLVVKYYMKLNYSPLHLLSESAKRILNTNIEKDEWEFVQKSFIKFARRNRDMLREQFIIELINGHIESKAILEQKALGANIDFIKKSYEFRLFIYQIFNSKGQDKNDEIKELYQATAEMITVFDTMGVHHYHTEDINKLQAIFLLYDDDLGKSFLSKMRTVTDREQLKNRQDFNLSLGTRCKEPEDVAASYKQARELLHHGFIKGSNNFFIYEDYINPKTTLEYPVDELKKLSQSIKQRKLYEAINSIDYMEEYIKAVNNVFFASCIGSEIVNIALHASSQLNVSFYFIFEKHPELRNTVQFSTLGELVKSVKVLIQDIIAYNDFQIQEGTEQTNFDTRFITLLKFIDNNYNDINFSIKLVSSEFHMSVSNLSHYFKKHLGINVSDYVKKLRLEKAKNLMLDKNLNLEEIAYLSGYGSITTLIRNFKQLESMTPGEFRRMIVHGNTDDW